MPTTATIFVADCTVNDFAGTPPKLTDKALKKLLPVMVTASPDLAELGEMLETTGFAIVGIFTA